MIPSYAPWVKLNHPWRVGLSNINETMINVKITDQFYFIKKVG